jgi:hypothetical protein
MPTNHFSIEAKHYENNAKRVNNVANIANTMKNRINFSAPMPPPIEALEQTVRFDDFTIQRDFDFGA